MHAGRELYDLFSFIFVKQVVPRTKLLFVVFYIWTAVALFCELRPWGVLPMLSRTFLVLGALPFVSALPGLRECARDSGHDSLELLVGSGPARR
jgi:hypothetical protein